MLNRIESIQGGLVRIESYVLLACVLAMLSLATYNVFYRNVLVPLQTQLREVRAAPAPSGSGSEEKASETGEREATDEVSAETADEPSGSDSDGFGGGFGAGESDEGKGESFGADASDQTETSEGEPVWWASAGVRTIAWLKLSWVDTFLRHMVLVVGFLGGMLAARRREHITIDAVGRLLGGRAYHVGAGVVTLFATVACGALARAGADLVAVSLDYPDEVMPGIQLWVVQLVFPIGVGVMGVHFLLRTVENAIRIYLDEPVDAATPDGGEGSEAGEGAP